MKKRYYGFAFAAVALVLVALELVDNWTELPVYPWLLMGGLGLVSAAAGFFSTSRRRFDLGVTLLMPFALFCCMFVAGFLDKDDLETRFHLYKAVGAAFQPVAWQLYALMAAAAFAASFKPLRSKLRPAVRNA